MNSKKLRVVKDTETKFGSGFVDAMEHHKSLVDAYLNSHLIRNHAPSTYRSEQRFLSKWFEQMGSNSLPLFTWQVMSGLEGKVLIKKYHESLLESGLHAKTVRGYLGILRKYFSFVLEFPIAKSSHGHIRIDDFYGVKLCQPIGEFDIPLHTYDGEDRGIPLDPGKLFDFYSFVRKLYLKEDQPYVSFRSRSYTMMVLAGESGLRIAELRNLLLEDLFFDSNKIQTRFAKGDRGSGKKARVSLFSPFAQETVRHFISKHRKTILRGTKSKYVFPSQLGNPCTYQICQRDLTLMVDILIKADFPVAKHLGWHWLRRIFATRFIEQFPGKLSVLTKLLGHSSMNTVHRYIRHSDAWIDDEIRNTLESYCK